MRVQRKLSVFLCHASQDKPVVRELYQRLFQEGWIDPWLDEEKLLPGQDWDLEIEKAVESADVVIVCVSSRSVTKEGYVQKEIRRVLDIALEKPEETIFIIPLRLDECELPRRLRAWHYVDYFSHEQRNRAYARLLQSLRIRFAQFGSPVEKVQLPEINTLVRPDISLEEKESLRKGPTDRVEELGPSKASGTADVGGSILLIIYLAIAAIESFMASSDDMETLLAISAILAGTALLLKRQMPTSMIFKISLTLYLLIYGLSYRVTDDFPVAFSVAGAAALVSGLLLALTIKVPKKPAFYAPIFFVAFLFLVGVYELVTNIGYSSFTNTVDTLILLTSIITSILLWTEL